MIWKIVSIFATIPVYCAGWKIHPGYPQSYSYAIATYSIKDPVACMKQCISLYYQTRLDLTVITTYLASTCYCGNRVFYGVTSTNSNYKFGLLWRPPVNFNNNPLEIGQSYTAYVYINEFIGGNDTFHIYVTKDLQNLTKESGSIIIDSWVNLPGNYLNEDGPRYLQRSEISKRNSSIMETFPTLTHFIQPHYTFVFMVMDTGVTEQENNWFVSLFINDKIIVIDLKSYNVLRPPKTCKAKVQVSSQLYSDKDHRVIYNIKTADGCVADIENVTINIIWESMLEGTAVFNKSCIDPTEVKTSGSFIEIKFSRLFIRSEICFMIKYKAVRSLRGFGSKKVIMLGDLAYTEFENDVATEVKRKDTFSAYVSKGVQGFFIRDVRDGYCFSNPESGKRMKSTFQGCEFFKLGQHNLLDATGRCMSLNGTTPIIGKCDKKRNIKIKERDIELLEEGKFLYAYGGNSTLADSVTNSYERRYTGVFGLSGDLPDGNNDIDNSTGISIVVAGNKFIACANPNKRNQRCTILFTEPPKARYVDIRMYTVIGYNNETGFVYGKDKNGNKLRTDNAHGVVFIFPRHWTSVMNSPNMTLAKHFVKKDLLNTIPGNEFVIDRKTYKATYYGIMELHSNINILLWTPEKNCHLTVGKSEAAALPTCMAIKSYCKKAKSGIYWIGGPGRVDTGTVMVDKGQVYCDMEADGELEKVTTHVSCLMKRTQTFLQEKEEDFLRNQQLPGEVFYLIFEGHLILV